MRDAAGGPGLGCGTQLWAPSLPPWCSCSPWLGLASASLCCLRMGVQEFCTALGLLSPSFLASCPGHSQHIDVGTVTTQRDMEETWWAPQLGPGETTPQLNWTCWQRGEESKGTEVEESGVFPTQKLSTAGLRVGLSGGWRWGASGEGAFRCGLACLPPCCEIVGGFVVVVVFRFIYLF